MQIKQRSSRCLHVKKHLLPRKSTGQTFYLSPHPERCRRDSSGHLLPLSLDVFSWDVGWQDNYLPLPLCSAWKTSTAGNNINRYRYLHRHLYRYNGFLCDMRPTQRTKKTHLAPWAFHISGPLTSNQAINLILYINNLHPWPKNGKGVRWKNFE